MESEPLFVYVGLCLCGISSGEGAIIEVESAGEVTRMSGNEVKGRAIVTFAPKYCLVAPSAGRLGRRGSISHAQTPAAPASRQ